MSDEPLIMLPGVTTEEEIAERAHNLTLRRLDLDDEARCPAWLTGLAIAAFAYLVVWGWGLIHGIS